MKAVVAAVLCGAVLASGVEAVASCFGDNSTHAELLYDIKSLPTGSGLIVTWGPRGLVDPLASGGKEEDPKAWKLASGADPIELTTTSVAPGLLVIAPAKPVTGAIEATDPQGNVHTLTFSSDALPDVLPAPRASAIKRRVVKGRGYKQSQALVKLRGDVPSGAVALIAYVGSNAVGWGRPGAAEGVTIFHDAIPCWSAPNDAPAPRAGTKIQLAWLDRSGRLSKRSAAIAIR